MKKNSKLALIALLALSFGLTACGGSTNPSTEESTVSPVERIEIKQLPKYVVVGEAFNLEDYVIVHGGAGATDFTASVGEAYAEIVSINGHNVTVLKEGEFTINIKAGAQEAIVSGQGILKMKNELSKLFDEVLNAKKWACLYTAVDDEGYTVLTGEKNVHASNYFINSHDEIDETTYEYIPGGLLVAADGNTYMFTADDGDGTNIDVKSGAQSDFGLYFCNNPFSVDVSKFEVVTDDSGDEPYEYLVLSNEVPANSQYTSYFSCKVDELSCYWFGNGIESSYPGVTTNDLEVYPYENEEGGYDFEFAFSFEANGKSYYYETCFLTTDPEIASAKGVEDYIASGEVPPEIPFTELTEKIQAAVDAKSYSFSAQYGFFDDDGALLDWSEVFGAGFHPSWEPYFADAIEEGVVTADGMYTQVTSTTHYNPEDYEPYETPVTSYVKGGMLNHDGKVYDLNETDDLESEYLYEATEIEDATDMWTDCGNYLAAGLVPGEGFMVSDRVDNEEDGSIYFEIDSRIIASSYALLLAYQLKQAVMLVNGSYNVAGQDPEFTKYIGVTATVTADGVKFFWGMRFVDFTVGFTFEISEIGGEHELPFDIEKINFGEAPVEPGE